MSLIKNTHLPSIITLIIFYISPLIAPHAYAKQPKPWIVGIENWHWNEFLRVQDLVTISTDVANFNCTIIRFGGEYKLKKWIVKPSFKIGSGIANGGGNSEDLTYDKENVDTFVLGGDISTLYPLTENVIWGFNVLSFYRKIDWPNDNPNQTIYSGRNIYFTTLFETDYRLTRDLLLHTSLGPLTWDRSTIWNIGISYRIP